MSTTDTAAENTIEGAIVEVKPDNALVVIDPARYAAELFLPFQEQLAVAKRKAARVTYDIATKDGMASARELVRTFVKIRTSADKAKTEAKRPIDQAGKEILARFNLVKAAAEAEEGKHAKVIADEEARIEAEKQRKLAEERARVEEIEGRIAHIRNLPVQLTQADSCTLSAKVEELVAKRLEPAMYDDYLEDAVNALNSTIDTLRAMYTTALEREAEARRAAAEREELARLKAEKEAREKAEREAAAERERLARVEREQAEADRKAASDREADLQRQLAEMKAVMEALQRPASPPPIAAPVVEVPLVTEGDPVTLGVDLAAPSGIVTPDPVRVPPEAAVVPRPANEEIVDLVANHFCVFPETALGWLRELVKEVTL